MRPLIWVAATAAALTLTACSSDDTDVADTGATQTMPEAPPEPPSGLVRGGAQPVLGKLQASGNFAAAEGTPDINTVPTEVPAPPSSKEERDRAIEGLIADRTNARYTDQGGRTQPVAVRPFVDTPEAVRAAAVARLDTPAPERPAEPEVPEQAPLPPPNVIQADVGPRSPGVAPRRGGAGETDVAAAGGIAKTGGFRPLAEFQAAVYSKSSLAGTLSLQGGHLTPGDRDVLNTTAREQIDSRGKGVIRVVGHGSDGMERAITAARELQRLGVARDNLFIGVDNISGPTEVFFDRTQ